MQILQDTFVDFVHTHIKGICQGLEICGLHSLEGDHEIFILET